jgi:hypothetical protein
LSISLLSCARPIGRWRVSPFAGTFLFTIIHGRFREQARFLRRQFLQDGDLPFSDVLSEGIVSQAWDTMETIPPKAEWKNANGKF